MRDAYGRTINYMRISVTDRCNLRCRYCMPEAGIPLISHEEILRFEEIEKICRAAAGIGLKHVKLTGGEPLVRRGLSDLIRAIKQITGISTVTLTTNGVLLPQSIDGLAAAGLNGINISLDTMQEEAFSYVTRGGCVQDVLDGIAAVLSYPGITLKLNCVLNNDWREHVIPIAELGRKQLIHIRYIERMPLITEHGDSDGHEEAVLSYLEEATGPLVPYEHVLGSGPSHYYSAEGFSGKIGFISAVSHKFCDSCNRIRLTADGRLRLCLQRSEMTDLKTPLRSGCTKEELQDIMVRGLQNKPKEHQFGSEKIQAGGMSEIGG